MKCDVRRMGIGDIIMDVAVYPDFDDVTDSKLQKLTTYRKSGANPKSIKARRKKNKNKKTHRR